MNIQYFCSFIDRISCHLNGSRSGSPRQTSTLPGDTEWWLAIAAELSFEFGLCEWVSWCYCGDRTCSWGIQTVDNNGGASEVPHQLLTGMDAYVENTRWASFDIKFTRLGFENACWHHKVCRAIQQMFAKPSVVNLISKDGNLVFYLSVYQLFHSSNLRLWRNFWFLCWFRVISDVIQKCNVIMTW